MFGQVFSKSEPDLPEEVTTGANLLRPNGNFLRLLYYTSSLSVDSTCPTISHLYTTS
jgi:hypothetical protein